MPYGGNNLNMQLRNIGRAKCIVCPTNLTVSRASAKPVNYVLEPLHIHIIGYSPLHSIAIKSCCEKFMTTRFGSSLHCRITPHQTI